MDADRLIRSEPPRASRSKPRIGFQNSNDIPVVDITNNQDESFVPNGDTFFQASLLMARGRGIKYMRSGGLTAARNRVWAEREKRLMRAGGADEGWTNTGLTKSIARSGVIRYVDEDTSTGGSSKYMTPNSNMAVGAKEQQHLWRAWALVGYAHAAIAVAIAAVIVWGLFMFAWGVRADVGRKFHGRVGIAEERVRECQESWIHNGCDAVQSSKESTAPALRKMCEAWDRCAQQRKMAWMEGYSASIWAEVLAETVNAFAAKISSSSMAVVIISGIAVACLLSITSWRALDRRASDASASWANASSSSVQTQRQRNLSSFKNSPQVVRRLSFSHKSPH